MVGGKTKEASACNVQGLIYDGAVLMMSGWERCAKARFSRMMGIPNGAGCRKLFLFISSRASAVNETCFYLASRRVGIIGTVAIESMKSFRAFLLRKRESRPKPLLFAVFRARRGCPFAGGVRLRQKVWADAGWRVYIRPGWCRKRTNAYRRYGGSANGIPRWGCQGGGRSAARATGFQGRPLPYNRRYGSEQAAGDTVAMMPMESK